MSLKVRKTRCPTCIYRKDCALNSEIDRLESQVTDGHGFMQGYRICHYHDDVCCRGFWDNHKYNSSYLRVAQRLRAVEFVEV